MFKNLVIMAILSLVMLVASQALLKPELFPMHDYVHGARLAEMKRALADGHLPPRWSANFGFGYGMPLFLFYAPLVYYLGAGLLFLGLPLIKTVQALFLIANFLTLLGAYLLGRRLTNQAGGLLLATLYGLAPYRAVNLVVRGALSELWGMALYPFVLYALLGLQAGKKGSALLLTLSWTALILSHNLSALILTPFFFLLVAQHWFRGRQRRILLQSLLAFFLSLALSAYYVLPALIEAGSTQIKTQLLAGYFHYSNHFLYLRQFFQATWSYGGSGWGPDDGISFFLGYGFLFALCSLSLFFLFQLWTHWRRSSGEGRSFRSLILSQPSLGWLLLAGVSLWLTTTKASWFWSLIPPLASLQFPWRFLAPASFFLALASLLGFQSIPHPWRSFLTIFLIALTIGTSKSYFRPQSLLNQSEVFFYSDAERIQNEMSPTLPDYLPTSFTLFNQARTEALFAAQPSVDYQLIRRRTQDLSLQLAPHEASQLTLALTDFPGWRVYLDEQPIQHTTSAQGLVSFNLPANEQASHLRASFTRTPLRLGADMISLFALLSLPLYLLSTIKTRHDR